VDNFVQTALCLDCRRPVPRSLHIRNAGRCFVCACSHEYAVDHKFHAELERLAHRPTIPQRRS
jgi:hypothetical protein